MDSAYSFMRSVEKIKGQLAQYEDLLTRQNLENFKTLARNLNEALQEEENKGKILRLGIIGSVKAGKSSFLNALLFKGREVLPKAATPMTASLTKLTFSEKQFLNFVFYTPDDWQIIKAEHQNVGNLLEQKVKEAEKREDENRRASPYYVPTVIDKKKIYESLDVTESQKACYDLVEQANVNQLDFSLLGTSDRKEITSLDDVCSLLENYVGSSGTFSPIVKYVEMGINNPVLQDLEIVDTPGLNDPIRSRSEETYKFMCQCDAVFLLSRASQFLTEDDKELLHRTLLDNGIDRTNVSVIATQLDLGAQNEVGKETSYREALKKTWQNVAKVAKRCSVPQAPISVCSIFECMACKKAQGIPLGSDEQQIEKNLARFKEDVPVSATDFHKYSNMQEVHDKLKAYRQEKDRIINEHQKNRARESRRNFIESLNALTRGVESNSRMLRENDMGALETLRDGLCAIINSVSGPISNVFLSMETEVGQKFADLKNRILENAKNFEDIDVTSETHQETNACAEGWWIFKKTRYDTVNVTSYTAELSQALQQLRKYFAQCEKDVNDTIEELVDKNILKENLRSIVLPVYRKFEDSNVRLPMDEELIIGSINALVEKVNIPQWKFDNKPYNQALLGSFGGGKVENEEIYKFRNEFELQLQAMCKNMRKSLEDQQSRISDELLHTSTTFAGEVSELLDKQMTKLEEQMNDKKKNLDRYDECRRTLVQCKKLLVE